MRSEIDHPRWDLSWAVPSEHTIDDLEDFGLVRVQPTDDKTRNFVLTPQGREAGAALLEQLVTPSGAGGRAPSSDTVLTWLVRLDAEAPDCLATSDRLLERAVADGVIAQNGREALARRILGLLDEGYLSGIVPRAFGATEEQTLGNSMDLALTMKAHEAVAVRTPSRTINVLGDIIDSQVATGDITTYATFVQLLDQASAEIDRLDDIDEETKEEAKGLLARLRGKATAASGDVATGAAGELVAGVLARLIGLPIG